MQLTGKQIAQVRDALLSAYSRDSLNEMVRVELDETLDGIAGGENLRIVIFKLVTWADQNGRVEELIQGAYSQTPQNEQIRQLALDAIGWRIAARHAPSSSVIASVVLAVPTIQPRLGPASIDVFLSYSRKDGDAMHCVYDNLRSTGLSVWIDEGEGLEPGTSSWTSAIQEAIRQASTFVVLLSPDAAASNWVNNEIAYAQMQRKRCIPIVIAGDAADVVPIGLVSVQWIDGREDLSTAVVRKLVPALTHQTPPAEVRPSTTAQLPVESPTSGRAAAATAAVSVRNSPLAAAEQASVTRSAVINGAHELPPLREESETTLPSASSRKKRVLWLVLVVAVIAVGAVGLFLFRPFLSAPGAVPVTDAAAAAIPPAGKMTNPKDGAEYIYVPAGAFTMGSGQTDPMARDNEKRQTSFNVNGFWIMRAEVTNRMYGLCIKANACTRPNNNRWNDPKYADHPVTGVDWHQANDYAAWVGGRLPTEAEWEKACRGTDGRIWPWGDSAPTADSANYNGGGVNDTTPVGQYSPEGDGPYGLFDMAGNVWEWTSSEYRDYPYSVSDGRENSEGDASRTLRGGSFYDRGDRIRCAMRVRLTSDVMYGSYGFRVVSSAD